MHTRQVVSALAGAAFAAAFLVYCGVAPINATPDAGAAASASGSSTVRSGTRLRARVRSSPDGAREFLGWYDETLKTPCDPAISGDGKQRCVPSGGGNVFFTDAACAVAVFAARTSCAGPEPAVVRAEVSFTDACGTTQRARAYRAKDLIAPPSDQYGFWGGEDGCTHFTNVPDPAGTYRALEEIAPADLVELADGVE